MSTLILNFDLGAEFSFRRDILKMLNNIKKPIFKSKTDKYLSAAYDTLGDFCETVLYISPFPGEAKRFPHLL